MTAELQCYLSSILEVAETIEAISPEIGPAFREQLLSLRAGLRSDPTPEQVEESRAALRQILKRFCDQVRVHRHETELRAALDPLTGVANRRDLDRELAARMEGGHEFCLLLFDLNGFKEINVRYGHLYGDEVLKQLGARPKSVSASTILPGESPEQLFRRVDEAMYRRKQSFPEG